MIIGSFITIIAKKISLFFADVLTKKELNELTSSKYKEALENLVSFDTVVLMFSVLLTKN